MNTENKIHASTDNASQSANNFVQSLFDLGTEWAVLGISFGREALERSAKSLSLAAKTLSTVSAELEKKMAPVAPKATVVADYDTPPEPPAAA